MITITEIAKMCDVSPMTVSRVVNKKDAGRVSKKTRERVIKAVHRYNYRPSDLVRALRTGRTKMLAFVTDVSSNFFSWEVFAGIQEKLYPAGYDFLTLQWSPETRKEGRFIASIVDRRVEGILVFPNPSDCHYLSAVRMHNVPIVTIDREIVDLPAHFVGSDDYDGAFKAVEHLLELGHVKIAFVAINSHMNLSTTNRRFEGYRDAMLKHNSLPLPKKFINAELGDTQKCVSFCESLLTKKDSPTAIFANNDIIAGDIVAASSKLGISVPKNLSIVGFGDLPIANYLQPPLTTVHQNPRKIGCKAAELLMNLVRLKNEGELNSMVKFEKIELPIKFIKRDSTAELIK